ncbi:MAG: class I SAM-dependent methyltransferase [Thermoplasmata archaeon]|nr:MAG: class I SAM-dependent methyltransferase [Thermoplasmata archaeon]
MYDNVRGVEEEYVKYWTAHLAGYGKVGDFDRILDVGCGTGRYVKELATSGIRKLVGLDQSKQMLNRAVKLRSSENADWVQGRCELLPFKQNTFNTAFMVMVAHHIPEDARPGAYSEIYKVLKPGGRLNILTRSAEQIEDSLIALFPGVSEIDTVRMPAIPQLKSDLLDAGFSTIIIHNIPNYSIYKNMKTFIERVENKFISTLTMFEEADFQRRLEIFKRRLTDRFGDAEELYDPMEFTLVCAEKSK